MSPPAEDSPLRPLTALSPLDGRYRTKAAPLAEYWSEQALIGYRLRVEVEYFRALHRLGLPELPPLSEDEDAQLTAIATGFDRSAAERVKALEREINHDVKAVEYFLKEQLRARTGLPDARLEFVHFGLTSQDINNTAVPVMLRDALASVLIPAYERALQTLQEQAGAWRSIPLLARTHGQPASPTTLGKEWAVFATRLEGQLSSLRSLPVPAKFGGATGNLNAHYVAYPGVDWDAFATRFVEDVLAGAGGQSWPRLKRSRPTTQIEPYDGLAALFDNLRRANVILLDLARDAWQYISNGTFRQRVAAKEVGSSAMPHKVNPIDFENAEGNLGLANALLDHLANKLPVSRLQRDLTDSTVLRNIGVPLGHSLLALDSLQKGLGKIEPDREHTAAELEANWAVLAEAIQTILRRAGYPRPYEALKELTRTGSSIGEAEVKAFIEQLDVDGAVKAELRRLHPAGYLGNAGEQRDIES